MDQELSTATNGVDEMQQVISKRRQLIDRGPAWIVAITTCILMGLHYGLIGCGPVFFPALMEFSHQPISVVSWVVTGQFAVAFCLAPLYNRIYDFVNFRVVVLFSVLLTTLGCVGASYAKTLVQLSMLYTLLGGIGLGISVVRIVAIAAEYFQAYRTFALSIFMCGAGLGTFAYTNFTAFMIETFTWRSALTACGLVHLNVIPLCLFLRPVPSVTMTESTIIVKSPQEYGSVDHLTKIAREDVTLSISSFHNTLARSTRLDPDLITNASFQTSATPHYRIVIEFVKGLKCGTANDIIIEPITYISDPDPIILRYLEQAVSEYLELIRPCTNSVLVPIVFLIGDVGFGQTTNEATDYLLVNRDSSELLTSRSDMYQEELDMRQPPTCGVSLVGDAFTSTVLLAEQRRQKRRAAKEAIKRATTHVNFVTQRLKERDLDVVSTPIFLLVKRGWHRLQTTSDESKSGELIHMLGLGDSILRLQSNKAVEGLSVRLTEERTEDGCSREPAISGSRRKIASCYSMLSESGLATSVNAVYPQKRQSVSVMSAKSSKEAAALVASTFEDAYRTNDHGESKSFPSRFILSNPMFTGILLSRAFVCMTESIIFAHLNNLGIESGLTMSQAAGLLSYVGIAGMLSRLGTGLLGQFVPKCDTRLLTACSLLLVSIFIILIPHHSSYLTLSIFAVSYGLLVSPSFAFAPLMIYEIIGRERYNVAVSYWYQFEAVGFMIGGPIGGLVKEVNNSYADCFALAGISDFLASAIIFMQSIILDKSLTKLSSCFKRINRSRCRQQSTETQHPQARSS